MGTIVDRKKKDGTTSFTAQIRRKEGGKVVFTEAKTFSKRKAAEVWIAKREAELDSGVQPEKPVLTFDQLIDRFNKEREGHRGCQVLNNLRGSVIANVKSDALTTQHYITLLKDRLKVAKPQTVSIDLIYIRQLMVSAKVEWGMNVDLPVLEDAKAYAHRFGLVKPSVCRKRRISAEERETLRVHFNRVRSVVPMNDIVDFALASCRRLQEITHLRWEDINEEKRTCIVRNLKHPSRKVGNDQTAKLTPEALAIIQAQPRTSERIFPYPHLHISCSFYRATHICGIENLRFHDLRHEAISRLFEKGYAIHEVALFSLHERWDTLHRYTHLKAEDVPDR